MTSLINREGYMCCVGQFALQCGIRKSKIRLQASISEVGDPIKEQYHKILDKLDNDTLELLYDVNDCGQTLIEDKIKYISKILKDSGHTLKVILPNQETLKRIKVNPLEDNSLIKLFTFSLLVPIMFITT